MAASFAASSRKLLRATTPSPSRHAAVTMAR
jgi:hypothetical protein